MKFIEFGSDLGEFREMELAFFLAQPADPPCAIAVQTAGTDTALNSSCTRPMSSPYLLTH
ncbi:hypothetical protein [Actinomadura sp. 7K507]|uniref:hypothetical protein n=1 Tax=Actinomadura sp. 7K507 TaxID=2530365 RepID=UPI00104883E7|nr:hypothetical protein [Actinomadura sp. 7K507]TDC92269.1 hypothetical protein E1285_11610 [Actinomadura sp. 7K507]